jgi:hypothetical protein
MSAELIYKTKTPAALEWWRHVQNQASAAHAFRSNYIKRMTNEFGPTPGRYTESGNKDRALMVSRHIVMGLASGYDEKPPVDSGWRLDSKERYWAPKLATKAGKERAAELATLAGFDVLKHVHEIGIPGMVIENLRMFTPGFSFDEDPEVLYQTWGSGLCAADCERSQAEHPEIEWMEVPRSEWYAREESKAVSA